MRTIRTQKKEDAFLAALQVGQSVGAACMAAKLGRSAAYSWRREDQEFAKLWDDAVEQGTDILEDEALRRARDGTIKPIYQGGKKVGSVREYSDTLAIFLLKGRRPDKFKDRVAAEHTGRDGGPIETKDVSDQTRARALAAFLAKTKAEK